MWKNRRFAYVSLLACVGLLTGLLATPGEESKNKDKSEKKGTNTSKEPGKVTPAGEGVQQAAMANMLVEYGRKNKSANALVMAAEILAQFPAATENKDTKLKTLSNKGAADNKGNQPPAGADLAKTAAPDPARLIREAKKMAPEDKCLAEWADRVGKEKSRGNINGPLQSTGVVVPGYHDDRYITFRAGELASVSVSGNGAVTLSVYDENNRYVNGSEGGNPWVTWTPKWTGEFIIRVQNENDGIAPVAYTLYTN